VKESKKRTTLRVEGVEEGFVGDVVDSETTRRIRSDISFFEFDLEKRREGKRRMEDGTHS